MARSLKISRSLKGSRSLKTTLSRATAVAALMALATALGTEANAADKYVIEPVEETRVEFGTGWYIRGDLGVTANGSNIDLTITNSAGGTTNVTSENSNSTFTFGLGFGYRFSSSIRGDINFATLGGADATRAAAVSPTGPCTSTDRRFPDGNGGFITDYQSGTILSCREESRGSFDAQLLTANAYYDLPAISRIRPFLGLGFGVARINYDVSLGDIVCTPSDEFERCSGLGGASNDVPEWGGEHRVSNDRRSGVSYHVAGQAHLGAAFAINENLMLDGTYSYTQILDTALYDSGDATNVTEMGRNLHTFRVGLRYHIW